MTAPLLEIRATPSPLGNRIELEWAHPDPVGHPGVLVVRRQGTYPVTPDDGARVVEALNLPFTVDAGGRRVYRFADGGLAGETAYYYAFFPFTGEPRSYRVDTRNRAAAMAISPYGYGARMAALLPAIYHRYDHAQEPPAGLAAEDLGKGPLRRFLEIAGSHLDLLHGLARSVLDLHDLQKVDGRLLPLLAGWIGWPTDHRIEIRAQRSEIRKAPHVYRTIGIVPTVEATVKRIIGWESRTKELAHNVVLSNRPERLNLWLAERDSDGGWSQPTAPLSLHFAYEGRPAAAHEPAADPADDTTWLFFHTLRKQTRVTAAGRRGQWDIWYKTFSASQGWSGSLPLTDGTGIDKHPAAALQGETLWVFWNTWSDDDRGWRLCYRTRQQGVWSPAARLWDAATERRRPRAVADGAGGLWLFWEQRTAAGWEARYNRHDGNAWELPPQDAPGLGHPAEDLFVLFDPAPRLWAFYARREPAGGPWRIAYRVKPSLDLAAADWEPARELPPDDPAAGDREPAAALDVDGNPELFWSSNHDRSWSIRSATLDPVTFTWSPRQQLTGNPFTQRGPLVAAARLFYYSNQSLTYVSDRYRATETVDNRYAGSTTVDTRNAAKIALRGGYADFQTYTFDTGSGGRRGDLSWYARDTVALYLAPSSEDPSATFRDRNVIASVLRQFLPIQVRAVLVIEPAPYRETIYTYAFPAAPRRVIGELIIDTLSDRRSDSYGGANDDHTDAVPDWTRIHSWSVATPDHRSVDSNSAPIDLTYRTWHVGLEQEEEP